MSQTISNDGNRQMQMVFTAYILLCLLLPWPATFSGVCQARVIAVDPNGSADHATIQAAINAAHTGDTVTVRAGTYVENVTLRPGLAIVGAGAKETTIDGGGKGPVVRAENVDSTARLEGFTITNGSAENGGGMRCVNSSPTIARCIFTRNRASGFGGGMYNHSSSPTISHCAFSENSAVRADSGGGGIYNVNNSSPILTDCSLSVNTAMRGFGGAMANAGNSRPKLSKVTFSANEAVRGGGIHNESGSDPNLQGVTFSANQARSHGGAIDNLNSNPRIADCVFSANAAFHGGAIFNDGSSPEVVDCVFSANRSGSIGGIGGGTLNVLEGLLWLAFAVVFLAAVGSSSHSHRLRWALAGLPVFLLGSLSEFYEAIGGGWWTPELLFLAKTGCGIVLILLYVWYGKTGPVPGRGIEQCRRKS